MKPPEWSLVQYRVDDSEKVTVGAYTDGTVVQGPPGTEGLTLMDVLARWESLAPLFRDWAPATADAVAGARLAPPLTYPGKVLCAGANYWDHIAEMGCEVYHDMKEGLKDADVVMMLRLQRERMSGAFVPSVREYFHFYGLDAEKLKAAKEDALVMHPGPMNRGVEIASEIADGPQSVIGEQVEMGVAVRMAVMEALLVGQNMGERA